MTKTPTTNPAPARRGTVLRAACALAAAVALHAVPAAAGDTIRIGVLNSTSGQFSDLGQRLGEGIRLYMKLHGDTIAGKRVELVERDDTGPVPDVAKRLTLELVTREKVDLLIGYIATPNALSSIPVAAEAHKPMLLIQAATAGLTERSPYVARLSYTLADMTAPIGQWAATHGIRTVYTIVADYTPGYQGEEAFIKAFTAAGGRVVGSVKVPLASVDYAVFLQRARNEKPDAVFGFVPAGRAGIAFAKTFDAMGLAGDGVKLITTGDIVVDSGLDAIGDSALGVISTFHYSITHDSPENKAFIKAFHDMYGAEARVDFITMQAYDAMDAIYTVAARLNGDIDPDKFMAALSGLKIASPRGPITIDPQTRNVRQTIYIRRVEKRDGHLYNIEFDTVDPGAAAR